MESVKKTESLLFRLKDRDTIDEISSNSFHNLINVTGMNKTKLVHYALSKMRDSLIPKYEMDDGPITDEQLRILNELTGFDDIPEEFYEQFE